MPTVVGGATAFDSSLSRKEGRQIWAKLIHPLAYSATHMKL